VIRIYYKYACTFEFEKYRFLLVFVKMESVLVRSRSGPDFLDFPGLLLFFVEIMSDKVILDHKKSYLVWGELWYVLR